MSVATIIRMIPTFSRKEKIKIHFTIKAKDIIDDMLYLTGIVKAISKKRIKRRMKKMMIT
jgi:hypothetical protein